MKQHIQRILCLLLTCLLCASAVPALADVDEATARGLIEAELTAMADQADDPWVKLLLSQITIGAADQKSKTVTFALTVPSPSAKAVTVKPAADPVTYLTQLTTALTASTATEEAELNLSIDGSGAAEWSGKNGPSTLLRKVSTTAAKAAKAMAGKNTLTAVTAMLTPASAGEFCAQIAAAASLDEAQTTAFLPALLSTQTIKSIAAGSKPTELLVTLTIADPAALAAEGYDSAFATLSGQSGVPDMTADQIAAAYGAGLTAASAAHQGKKAVVIEKTIALDLADVSALGLAGAIDFVRLYTDFVEACGLHLTALTTAAADMPPYASQARPETSLIKGAGSGTSLVLETEGSKDVYVKFVSGDSTVASAYLRAGETLTMQLAQGEYTLCYGKGGAWYGEVYAFGPEGTYGEGTLTVGDSKFQHTLRLFEVEEGNMPTSAITLENFLAR